MMVFRQQSKGCQPKVIPMSFSAFRWARGLALVGFLAMAGGCAVTKRFPAAEPRVVENWITPEEWSQNAGAGSAARLSAESEAGRAALRVDYTLPASSHGYVELIRPVPVGVEIDATPVALVMKARGPADLEVKFVDADGSVFGRKIECGDGFSDWTPVVLDRPSVEYWWGGQNGEFGEFRTLMIVPSGQGTGTVWFSTIGISPEKLPSTLTPAGPQYDPDRELAGVGFRQRRDAELVPEDPLVLEWLKYVQDTTCRDQRLLGTLEDTNIQTFNNALAATAFLVKGERERAERILDFFAGAEDRANSEPLRQNFFYRGEARGFFQNAHPVEKDGQVLYYGDGNSDRWMGDMVWLMYAYLYYDQLYGAGRYADIEKLITDLLDEWYKESPDGKTGYVQHGWRKGDAYLHENHGHHEGNIDCYALYNLLGRKDRAQQIRTWLDSCLSGDRLPLDLYTWRSLAYGPDSAALLDIPDFDFRFRKTMTFNGRRVVGVYHSADITINNIWVDGVGHIACAYFAVGNPQRGNFYANQLDGVIVDRDIGGRHLRALPYVLNEQGGFGGMAIGKGSVSPVAWYIFAKNRFNPMTLRRAE